MHSGLPRLQLPRLTQICIDPCLPAGAGFAIGGEHVSVEAELHRLFWIRLRRPAAADDPVAIADFGAIEKLVRQSRRVVGINPFGGARLLLPWHDSVSSR